MQIYRTMILTYQHYIPHTASPGLHPYQSQLSPFRPSTHENHVAFPRESTTAFWFPHSNTAESKCGNHNPSTTPTLLQPMPACAAVAYMAYTLRARTDMDAVQCY